MKLQRLLVYFYYAKVAYFSSCRHRTWRKEPLMSALKQQLSEVGISETDKLIETHTKTRCSRREVRPLFSDSRWRWVSHGARAFLPLRADGLESHCTYDTLPTNTAAELQTALAAESKIHFLWKITQPWHYTRETTTTIVSLQFSSMCRWNLSTAKISLQKDDRSSYTKAKHTLTHN